MTTSNMGLTQPTVLVTAGPTYGTQQNTDLTLIDAHDHSSGKGVQVSQTGLLFTGDLSYKNGSSYYGPINLAYAQFHAQTLQGAGTKTSSLMVNASGDLYFQNGSGTNVQLTSGGAILANGTGAANGFYGDYASAVAKANFVSAAATYSFWTDNLTTYGKIAALGYRSLGSTANSTGFINVKSDGSAGWQLWNNTGAAFYLTFDPTGTPLNALTVQSTGANNQYALTLNTTSATGAIETSLATEGSTIASIYSIFHARTGTAVPADDFGQTWQWKGSIAAGTAASTFTQIAMDASWKTASTKRGRWRIWGWLGNSQDATPAIEAIGGGAVGIFSAANPVFPLTVGAIAGVSATMNGSLTVSAGGASITGGATVATGNLAVSAGTITSSGALTVSGGGANITGGVTAATGNLTASAGSVVASGNITGVNGTFSGGVSATGNLTSSADIVAVGGFRSVILATFTVCTASQTDAQLGIGGNVISWTAPYAGSVMAISWSDSAVISAGTISFRVFKNGSALTGTQSTTYSSGSSGVTTFAKDTLNATFSAGDVLDVRYTSSGTFADSSGINSVAVMAEC